VAPTRARETDEARREIEDQLNVGYVDPYELSDDLHGEYDAPYWDDLWDDDSYLDPCLDAYWDDEC
jgi:hypothetical protein